MVETAGLTLRVAGLAEAAWMKPSDHVTDHGPAPVRSAETVAELPRQMVVEPLTVAVGPRAANGDSVER